MLITTQIRERLNPGDKVTLKIDDNTLKISNGNHMVDEMHNIFMKNRNIKKGSIVEEFIQDKRKDFKIEQTRGIKK